MARRAAAPARTARPCWVPWTPTRAISNRRSPWWWWPARPLERLQAFKQERGWQALRLHTDLNDAFSRDYHGLLPDGSEVPAFNVFTRRDGTIRHFWSGEITEGDPGQDPRGAPDLAPLWNVLDMTREGRGTDWYPKLSYPT